MELWIERNSARGLPEESRRLSLVVSSTFTAEPIGEYIDFWCKTFNQAAVITFAPYNQVFQELLDTSSLISNNIGANILLIRFEDWIRSDIEKDELKLQKLYKNYQELLKIICSIKKPIPFFIGVFPVSTHLRLSERVTGYLEEMNAQWKRDLKSIENVYLVDFYEAFDLYSLTEVFDSTGDKAGHMPFSDEFIAVMGTMIARRIFAWKRQIFKLIVMDCDNTLWKGICGEDSPEEIDITEPCLELQRLMLQKYNEGMLLALCSRNNERDVWNIFDNNPKMLLKKEHFAAYRINWQAKSQNIIELAEELKLGTDSFIFMDDSPYECTEVIQNCPQVLTLLLPENHDMIKIFLRHVWAFDKLKITHEDMIRNQTYAAERERYLFKGKNTSLEDFLSGLDVRMSVRPVEKQHVARVSQLTQRTNQFNLSTIRRTEKEINELLELQAASCRLIEVADRFGEYGIVGVVVTEERGRRLIIETLLLSCRVLGKCIEDAVLTELARYCTEKGITEMEATYSPTEKNKPVLNFLEKTGWSEIESTRDYTKYLIEIDKVPRQAGFVKYCSGSGLTQASKADGHMKPAGVLFSNPIGADVRRRNEKSPDFFDLKFSMPDWEHLLHKEYIYPLKYCRVEELLELTTNKCCKTGTQIPEQGEDLMLRQKLGNLVFGNLQGAKVPEELDDDLKLTDMGINSISFIKLIVGIEKAFAVKIGNEDLDFYKYPTFGALVSYVEERTGNGRVNADKLNRW
ncbi:phosphopantetheine attachment site [Ruminiclostridium hungatei]|uniref:Phosphopantetheine attachment site n=1 Tax=Ruminiclostridium hungatei TaxID=48256 RepID=A0A1V4SPY0_RUMHU|nr:HAD-IIIC family phosphatase [Ruminiclostridium hungatei]OPX45904.1 phosphopantetheine attachment site [Ruminiclostridium hungatei]